MDAHEEAVRYGYTLYPFAILALIGSALTVYGNAGLHAALAIRGPVVVAILRALFAIAVTVLGAATVFAAVFGALYRVLEDTQG